jgi:hypothetical protein
MSRDVGVSDEMMKLIARGGGATGGGVARCEGWLPSENNGIRLVRCFLGG